MIALFMVFLSLSFPTLKNRLLRKWYQYLTGTYGIEEWTFINFGYAPNGNPKEEVHLEERDADNQYGIYLYRHVVSDINLRDLDVFEIGCSRGGGAEYSKRNL